VATPALSGRRRAERKDALLAPVKVVIRQTRAEITASF
jgi:hypothetical protein